MEEEADLVCYPMHGEIKVIKEGFRTRDGHLIQWFSRLCSNPIVFLAEASLGRV